MPLIRHAGRSSGSKLQTLIAVKVERERDTARCLHTNLFFFLAWFLFRISKRNVWVNQSCYNQKTQNPNLSCASAFVRHSRTFHSINALRTHIFKLPEYHSGLIWILTVFANVEREREREHIKVNIPSADRLVEREVCVCVCMCVRVCVCVCSY